MQVNRLIPPGRRRAEARAYLLSFFGFFVSLRAFFPFAIPFLLVRY
jgi:hypothetical protein